MLWEPMSYYWARTVFFFFKGNALLLKEGMRFLKRRRTILGRKLLFCRRKILFFVGYGIFWRSITFLGRRVISLAKYNSLPEIRKFLHKMLFSPGNTFPPA